MTIKPTKYRCSEIHFYLPDVEDTVKMYQLTDYLVVKCIDTYYLFWDKE